MTDGLLAISPLDGRYAKELAGVREFFSEYAYFKYRLLVEVEYLAALHRFLGRDLPEEGKLRALCSGFSLEDAGEIKEIEGTTRHDVKALEHFIRQRTASELVHFALTSEDVNNLALSLSIRDFSRELLLPSLRRLLGVLADGIRCYRDLPMLARTHGQPAVPTTVGKEFAVFAHRLARQVRILEGIRLTGKLNGAVGNFSAHYAAFPDADWVGFSGRFVSSLGLEPQLVTTQVEPADTLAEFLHCLARINNILLGLCQDMWRYISDGWFLQRAVAGEVGSSTMPQKVNPIDFENAEGNLGLADALLLHLASKPEVSRLQRDLSDSTVKRNLGVAFGHCLLAYDGVVRGLSAVAPDGARMRNELEAHPEILAEAIQTILRAEGMSGSYEKLKELTRGKKVTLEELRGFCSSLDVPEETKTRLLQLTPANYLGAAGQLCDFVLAELSRPD